MIERIVGAILAIIAFILGLLIVMITWALFEGTYEEKGKYKLFFHDVLGHHVPLDPNALNHSKCKYCNRRLINKGRGEWE